MKLFVSKLVSAVGVFSFLSASPAVAAKHSFDPCVDWSRVTKNGKKLSWMDGCKGDLKAKEMMCTEMLVFLTPKEIKQYTAWIKAKRPAPPANCFKN